MLSEVCDCLNISGLEADAIMVIGSFGKDASEELQRYYISSSGNLNTSIAILHLLNKSMTKESTNFMFARLWSNSRILKEIALKCLMHSGYKAENEEKDKLNQLISDTIGMITWNIAAQISLAKNNDEVLLEVIRKETNAWNSFLFDLLSITYDSGSIAKIRANIESGTVESVNYALEMIDIVIDDSIKAKLVSLIDVVSDEEKLKNLHQFFPCEVPQYDQLIEDILNRDYNIISTWTKAFTLRHMTSIPGENAKESVIALLFSPENFLQQEAAHLISRTDKNLINEVIKRLPHVNANLIGKIVAGSIPPADFIFEKVKFLSQLFHNIDKDELILLAGFMRYYNATELAVIIEIQDSILWKLAADNSVSDVSTISQDNLEEYKKKHVGSDVFFYLLPLKVIEDFRNFYPEDSFEIFNYLDK